MIKRIIAYAKRVLGRSERDPHSGDFDSYEAALAACKSSSWTTDIRGAEMYIAAYKSYVSDLSVGKLEPIFLRPESILKWPL